MTYTEDQLLPLSALQHLLFCERQCALIHLEQVWVENRQTAEGRILHRQAHDGKSHTRDGVRVTRSLALRSLELGLSGQADVIEWRPPPGLSDRRGDHTLAQIVGADRAGGLIGWTLTPIEYKRGRPKANDCDRVQLCAQALCLEEMLRITIASGQLFYGSQRRRFDVAFNPQLRELTRRSAERLHEMFNAGITPLAIHEKKCETCSLLPVCLPRATGSRQSAIEFFEKELQASLNAT